VRYDDFVLIAADNRRYSDIPPDQIKGNTYERLSPYWAYSDAYYVDVRLPTEACFSKRCLKVSSLIAQRPADSSTFTRRRKGRLQFTFSAVLVDARTGQRFGSIDVPLRIEWF